MSALRRGEHGYEEARRGSLWNALAPERYPELIVRPRDASEVAAAVRLARSEGLEVTVCSGGHSWAANHLREGVLLIDLGGLDSVRLDPGECDGGGGTRLPRNRAARPARPPRAVLPGRPLRGRGGRRLPAAGRVRLERACPWARVHERRGDRRGHRRGGGAASRRAHPQPAAVGRPRVGTRLLRRRDRLSPAPAPAAGGGGQRGAHLPDRRARGPLPLGRADRPTGAPQHRADAARPPRR